jgi:hypothetical protein
MGTGQCGYTLEEIPVSMNPARGFVRSLRTLWSGLSLQYPLWLQCTALLLVATTFGSTCVATVGPDYFDRGTRVHSGISSSLNSAVLSQSPSENLKAKPNMYKPAPILLASRKTYVPTAVALTQVIPNAIHATVAPIVSSTISSNFNGTAIPAGDYIWFNAVANVSGISGAGSKVIVQNQSVAISVGGQTFTVPLPNSAISFSNAVTSSNTYFDSSRNQWITTVPLSYSGNVFLGGGVVPLPNGLSGGANPVSWTGTFYTDTLGISLNWKWAAAAYSVFSTDLNAVQSKPIDGTSLSPYQNSDHAGTAEAFKNYVLGGARGGGGSNFTGSYSGTTAVTPAPYLPPVAKAGPNQTAYVMHSVRLDGTGSTDPEGNPLTYSWSIVSEPNGSNAALTSTTIPTPSFTVDKPGSYVFQLVVNDGQASSGPSLVTITTLNSAPVANAGPDGSGTTTSIVQIDGSKSTDVDGDPLTYSWTLISKPATSNAMLSDSHAAKPTFVIDIKGEYALNLVVNDGKIDSSPDHVEISTSDTAPVAVASATGKINVGNAVTLDGRKSFDIDSDSLSYRWSLIDSPSGSTATLSDTTAVSPTFVPDQLGAYIVQLIVNDGTKDSAAVTVAITSQDQPPTANAGQPQPVYVGESVTLDGTASTDVDGYRLSYAWSISSKPAGSTATLSDSTLPNPTIVVDKAGDYVIQLIVNDGFFPSAPSTVTISTLNSPPVANAGPDQPLVVGNTVQLDGSKSTDVDGDVLTYHWSLTAKPGNSAAAISSSTSVAPTFMPDVIGTYVAQLVVNDGKVDGTPATVTISAKDTAPLANAGPAQTVALGALVSLDGSDSTDAEHQSLTYRWALLNAPANSQAALSNSSTVNPRFTADRAGDFVLQLIVNDGYLDSVPSTVTISTLNSTPVANPGQNQSVFTGVSVRLMGVLHR